MDALLAHGIAVFPLPAHFALHTEIPAILGDMPELLDPLRARDDLVHPISDAHPSQVVLGGFGATGCPSLSHHPGIRTIRRKVYAVMRAEFARGCSGRRLEVLFDRFGIRRKGTAVGAESWHRDVGPKAHGDIIYGGWVNLDPPGTPPQKFSCIPGNVLPPGVDPLGFAKFPKEAYPALETAFSAVGPLAVPPGHLIVFNQSIAHKITGATAKFTSYRLYMGWRITDGTEPVYDKHRVIQEQSMPPMPSGQAAPMYAKLHWVNWQDRLREFSTRFKPEFLEGAESKRAGCVLRELPGLVATGHAFAPYTAADTAMFFPVLLEQAERPAKRPCL